MKKASTWAAIFGLFFLVISGFALVSLVTDPTNLPRVNVANGLTQLQFLLMGIFLLVVFVKFRTREETKLDQEKPEPNSQEDRANFIRRTRWVLGFVLLVDFIGSSQVWILNNYLEGVTLVNLHVIFDLLIHIPLAYLIYALFRGQKDVRIPLLYSILVYTVGSSIFYSLEGAWYTAVAVLLFGGYFLYAMQTAISRSKFRLAHFVFLPAVLVLMTVAPAIEDIELSEMIDEKVYAERQFEDETSILAGSYLLFLGREEYSSSLVQEIENSVAKRAERREMLVDNINRVADEYKTRIATIEQQINLEWIRFDLLMLEEHEKQEAKILEYMNYVKTLNHEELTDEEESEIRRFRTEIDEFGKVLSQILFERYQANLAN